MMMMTMMQLPHVRIEVVMEMKVGCHTHAHDVRHVAHDIMWRRKWEGFRG